MDNTVKQGINLLAVSLIFGSAFMVLWAAPAADLKHSAMLWVCQMICVVMTLVWIGCGIWAIKMILKTRTARIEGELMNGIQIEHLLSLIDCSIDANMLSLHGEVLNYLKEHRDDLAREILENGYGKIQTRIGPVRISKEDLEPTEVIDVKRYDAYWSETCDDDGRMYLQPKEDGRCVLYADHARVVNELQAYIGTLRVLDRELDTPKKGMRP